MLYIVYYLYSPQLLQCLEISLCRDNMIVHYVIWRLINNYFSEHFNYIQTGKLTPGIALKGQFFGSIAML